MLDFAISIVVLLNRQPHSCDDISDVKTTTNKIVK